MCQNWEFFQIYHKHWEYELLIWLKSNLLNKFLAPPIPQEETCIERDSRDRLPASKLQSAIYYALDGDHVNILILLAQRGEDPWVNYILLFEHINISFNITIFLEWYISS